METAPVSPGLPGSPPPSFEYATAIDLLGHVIALQGARIAAERSRCHHDPALIAALQAERAAAVRAAVDLTSSDPQRLRETVERYRRVEDRLPAHNAGVGWASGARGR
ncbi:MAG TPA: hypothetical protein VHV82_14280 [Sporichthyaceae bacterium]|jgi:hypothetical protein|nr:hypothetical protein [Sporichthyaceae bacterium]